MKHRYFLQVLIVSVLLLSNRASAQLVGDNAFLMGRWLEVGIAPNGSWGNTVNPPAGYTTRGGSSTTYTDPLAGTTASVGLDFSYDQGHDGWAAGTPPWYGAYFLPGTPFDGWSVQIDDTMGSAFYSSGRFDTTEGGNFGGTVTGFTGPSCWNPHAPNTGIWQGTYGLKRYGLRNATQITQVNEVDTNASWLIVTTKFVNTSDSVLRGVYYMATADPDNDEVLPGGSFPTNNHISYQGGALDRHEVNARPPSIHQDAFSGLATQDCRAKALIYQSWPPTMVPGNNLDLVYAGTPTAMGATYYALGASTLSQDIAYGLVFNVGNIAPHDSAFICFAWIFSDTTAVDSIFQLKPQLSTLGNVYSPGQRDTVIGCNLSGCNVSSPTTFDADIINGSNRDWTFSNWTWSPTIGLSTAVGTHVTINVAALSGPTTYTITGTPSTTRGSCLTPPPVTFILYVRPCFNATNNGPVCVTDTLKLQANGDSTGATYQWFGPGGFTAFTQYTQRNPLLSMADTGWYTVVRTVGSSHDTARTYVMLKPLPVITASNNSPICSGPPNVLFLTSGPDSVGETFTWTGSNGFTTTLENPSISGPAVSYSGVYKVVALWNGCKDSAYTTVIIDTTPVAPVLTSNSPLCSPKDATHGSTLLLTATDATPGVTYMWTGPGGFVSFMQNPSYALVPTSASGVYSATVTITADGITCTNTNSTVVTVDSTPYLPIMGSNAPICSGLTLLLTAGSSPGSSYSWTGPIGFASGVQNPSISPAITANSGVYTVNASIVYPGITCISDTATLAVVVDSTPQVPVASSNSPGPPSICERDTLKLRVNDATAGVTYAWAGPNSFTSTLQAPIIPNVVPAATGQYTVTATLNGLCSAFTVITVTITPTPILIATNNGPVCTGLGDTLFLEAASNPGATFSWTGPLVFLSTLQNPYRTPTVMEMAGVYQVTAFLSGCSSLPVNDTVVIRQTPPLVWVKDTFYCQHWGAPTLQAFGDSVLWYPTNNVNGPASLLPPALPTGSDTVMWFYVTQTVMGCRSALDSFSVTINPKPVVKVSPSVAICPHDSVTLVAADIDPTVHYHWSPAMYLSDTTGATVIAKPITNVTYEIVTTNKYGCHDTAYSSINVNSNVVLYLGDSVTLYPGESYQLEPQTNCTSFSWFPAAGLNNPYLSNPIATPQISTKYIVRGETSWGCVAVDSINIYVNPETLLALPNAFSPGTGPNSEFKIIKRGIATLNYFRIFDRWGNMVFETNNIDQGWDGTYKGAPQPFGVYVYQVSAVTSTGRNFEKHGNTTLIR